MWFLTKVWAPWWFATLLYGMWVGKASLTREQGSIGLLWMAWLGLNALITLVYIATRIYRRVMRESRPPY